MADPDWLETGLAGLGGAASGVLFDIPEAIAKQLSPKDFEEWKKRNETAYTAGNVAGTIGGSFIPVAGLLGKGIKAVTGAEKALGAGKALNLGQKAGIGLEKLASAPGKGANFGQTFARLGGRAALESGLGETVRSVAHGNDLGTAAAEGGSAALLGGLIGGGVGAGMSKAGEALGKLRESTRLADLERMGFDTRSLRKALKASGGGRTSEAVDKFLQDLQDVGKKEGFRGALDKGQLADKLRGEASEGYKALDDIYNANSSKIHDMMESKLIKEHKLDEKVYDTAGQMLGGKGPFQMQDVVSGLFSKFDQAKSLVNKRDFLNTVIEQARKGNTAMDSMKYDAAMAMKKSLDDSINEAVEQTGDEGLKSLGKKWKFSNALIDAENRGDIAIAKGTGSPTAEKALIGGLLGVGGGAVSSDWSDPDKLGANIAKTLGMSVGGAALSKVGAQAGKAVMSSADDLVKSILEKGGKGIAKVEATGEMVGPNAGKAIAAATMKADPEQKAAIASDPQKLAAVGGQDKQAYKELVKARLAAIWETRYAAQYPGDGAFEQFMAGAESASRGFDPERTAGLLYPDRAEREQYLAALKASKAVEQNIEQAGEKEGVIPFFKSQTEGAKLAESSLTSAAADSLKNAGIDAKTAKEAIRDILSGGGDRKAKLMELLQRFNPQGFAALKGAGL
jgi:hypothetical protein